MDHQSTPSEVPMVQIPLAYYEKLARAYYTLHPDQSVAPPPTTNVEANHVQTNRDIEEAQAEFTFTHQLNAPDWQGAGLLSEEGTSSGA